MYQTSSSSKDGSSCDDRREPPSGDLFGEPSTSNDDVINPKVGLELGGGVGGLFITFNFFFLQALFSGQVLDLGRKCLLLQLREKSSSPSSSSSPSPALLCLSDKSEILPVLGWMGSLGNLRGEWGGENRELIPLSLMILGRWSCPAVNVFARLRSGPGDSEQWLGGLGETDLILNGEVLPIERVFNVSCKSSISLCFTAAAAVELSSINKSIPLVQVITPPSAVFINCFELHVLSFGIFFVSMFIMLNRTSLFNSSRCVLYV